MQHDKKSEHAYTARQIEGQPAGESTDYTTSSNNERRTSSDHDLATEAPPAYEFHARGDGLKADAKMEDDGRIKINLDSIGRLPLQIPDQPAPYTPPNITKANVPRLNIVIQIVGSRGDIQPFIALGNALQAVGHRVRVATHDVFKDFVKSSGLEFFPIGGDPASLMAYMVNNPSIIPEMKTMLSGEISKKRKMIAVMLDGCWRSCIEPDPETGIPFVAEAIIANPPSFAHVHCAQALGVPLHLMFTMPWSPTKAFPQPLANIERTNTDLRTSNYLSYTMVELMTWQGLSDVFNKFRNKTLCLPPVPQAAGPLLCHTLQIPFTYCWSPEFVPKPSDWANFIDVCGFFFRQEPQYTPEPDLAAFLRAGSIPIYIGFGSIVIDNPDKLTNIIIASARRLGVRAIVSRGWSKLGSSIDPLSCPDIFFLGDCPHEWLFKQVSCVVHHGGAGTTACGLLNGCPTTIVPFFGDQAFWGQMIAAAHAGPQPIHHKLLSEQNLTEAIRFCLSSEAKSAAATISTRMKREDGVSTAVNSFQINLPVEQMRCDLLPDQIAVWQCSFKDKKSRKKTTVKLSDEAAFVLVENKKIEAKTLKLYQSKSIDIENPPWDPFSSTTSVLLGTLTEFTTGFGQVLAAPVKGFQADQSGGSVAAQSVGKGFLKMGTVLPKATLIDVPLALTEGLHQMPKLYGEEVRDHGKVTDMRSAGIVAGKNFGYGFMDGLSGFVTKPYKGAKEEGFIGFSKGVAKGSLGLITGPGSAMFGLFAYPFLGMYKSMETASLSTAQKQIVVARQVYGSHMARQRGRGDGMMFENRCKMILREFEQLTR